MMAWSDHESQSCILGKSVPIKLAAPEIIDPKWAAELSKNSEVATVITVIGRPGMRGWESY